MAKGGQALEPSSMGAGSVREVRMVSWEARVAVAEVAAVAVVKMRALSPGMAVIRAAGVVAAVAVAVVALGFLEQGVVLEAPASRSFCSTPAPA